MNQSTGSTKNTKKRAPKKHTPDGQRVTADRDVEALTGKPLARVTPTATNCRADFDGLCERTKHALYSGVGEEYERRNALSAAELIAVAGSTQEEDPCLSLIQEVRRGLAMYRAAVVNDADWSTSDTMLDEADVNTMGWILLNKLDVIEDLYCRSHGEKATAGKDGAA